MPWGSRRRRRSRALAPRPLPVDVLEPRDARRPHQGFLSVGLLVLFTALVAFGNAVAVSVTEEKSSRVVELLLTTVSPRRLLTGKVLGIGLLGVAQLRSPVPRRWPPDVSPVVPACHRVPRNGGARRPLVPSRIRLLQRRLRGGRSPGVASGGSPAASAAITAVLVGTFWLSMLAVDFGREPNTTVAQIAAFVPPTAPMIVPTRVVAGDMGALGLSVAVGLELLGTVGLIMLAARVYERAILRIGAPVRLRGLLGDEPQGREPTPRVPSAGPRLRIGSGGPPRRRGARAHRRRRGSWRSSSSSSEWCWSASTGGAGALPSGADDPSSISSRYSTEPGRHDAAPSAPRLQRAEDPHRAGARPP